MGLTARALAETGNIQALRRTIHTTNRAWTAVRRAAIQDLALGLVRRRGMAEKIYCSNSGFIVTSVVWRIAMLLDGGVIPTERENQIKLRRTGSSGSTLSGNWK